MRQAVGIEIASIIRAEPILRGPTARPLQLFGLLTTP